MKFRITDEKSWEYQFEAATANQLIFQILNYLKTIPIDFRSYSGIAAKNTWLEKQRLKHPAGSLDLSASEMEHAISIAKINEQINPVMHLHLLDNYTQVPGAWVKIGKFIGTIEFIKNNENKFMSLFDKGLRQDWVNSEIKKLCEFVSGPDLKLIQK